MTGILYIVATPIGNLEDITLRALRVLGEADVVFCEDTRVTRRLFEHYGIGTNLKSLNARTESLKINEVLKHLKNGKDVAYVSDAGTPCISDPGSKLVSLARENGISVKVVPGPSALTSTLSIAGTPINKFLFLGFLPQKKGRQTALREIAAAKYVIVLYESPHRILKLLAQLSEVAPGTIVTLARELTKVYEEVLRGSPQELISLLKESPEKQKGEFVVIISKSR